MTNENRRIDIRPEPGDGILYTGGPDQTLAARELAANIGGPLRAPHHTCSAIALLGELALAAGGVLYLDEVPEFRAEALSAMAHTWAKMTDGHRPTLVLGVREAQNLEDTKAIVETLGRVAGALPPVSEHRHFAG